MSMGTRGGSTVDQLKRFLQFKKENPKLSESESIEKFVELVDREVSIVQAPDTLGDGSTFPTRRKPRESQKTEKSLHNIHSHPIAIPHSEVRTSIGYLDHSIGLYPPGLGYASLRDAETIDPTVFNITDDYIGKSDSFANVSTQSIPRSCAYGSSVESSLSTSALGSSPTEFGVFTPEMSREASNSSVSGAMDMLRVRSHSGGSSFLEGVAYAQNTQPSIGSFKTESTYKTPHDSTNFASQRISQTGRTRTEPEKKPSTTRRFSSNSPKRKLENWPDSQDEKQVKKTQSLAPAEKPPTERSTNFTKRRPQLPYCRPKHPRVMCKKCPHYSEGFRGEHEYRRHYERVHAIVKRHWVVQDPSGGNFLAKCKSCSSGKRYGADYNATAHLKRQHFNPERNPDLKPPANFRDWIKMINVPREEELSSDGANQMHSSGEGNQKQISAHQMLEEDEGDETDEDDDDETLKGIGQRRPIQCPDLSEMTQGMGNSALSEAAASSHEVLENFQASEWSNDEVILAGMNDTHPDFYPSQATIGIGPMNGLNVQYSTTDNLIYSSSEAEATYASGSLQLSSSHNGMMQHPYLGVPDNDILQPQLIDGNQMQWGYMNGFADIR